MHIKPIKSQKDLDAALMKIDALFEAEKGSDEHDEFVVLSELVLSYCQAAIPTQCPDPIEALLCHMHWKDLTRKDLALLLESSSLAEEILSRRKHLTLPVIRSICKEWEISAEALIQEYDLEQNS